MIPLLTAGFLAMASMVPAAAQNRGLAPGVLEELRKVAGVFTMIQTDYVTPVEATVVLSSCMKAMVHDLDSQSVFLDKEAFEEFKRPPLADEVGIGVELTSRAGLPTVITAITGSAADQAGLRPRDYILEIDGHSMEETELPEAFKRLRGKAGSTVTLVLRRPGEIENRALTLTRTPVSTLPSVSSRRAPADIAYLRIRSLQESTTAEVRAEFRQLNDQRPLRGLVLDLRNSPGGMLTSAIELAAMFLQPDALIVTTEGRLPESNQTLKANRDDILKNRFVRNEPWPEAMRTVPLVVLVNGGTASGSEIIAAALKDNGRAKLIGSKTFGRGTIQTLRQLTQDSAIKLTTAYYKTPSGARLQGNGLVPDVPMPDLNRMSDAGTDQDMSFQKAMSLLGTRSARATTDHAGALVVRR